MKCVFGLFALAFLLDCSLISVSVKAQGVEDLDAYYLDSLGHICSDTVDTVQKVEYDSQIHCTVTPMLVCDDDEETSKDSVIGRRIGFQSSIKPSDDLLVEGNDPIRTFQRRPQGKKNSRTQIKGETKQVCHTMSVKECKTINRPKKSKVKVRVCPDDLPQASSTANELLFGELDPRFRLHRERSRRKQQSFEGDQQQGGRNSEECDNNGQRTVCTTRGFKTECTTTEISHEVKEDYPNCKLEMTDKCAEVPDKFGNCKRVPAMKCNIETKVVLKTKPETKCERVPKEFCRKQNCTPQTDKSSKDNDASGCYFREQTINEVFPEEKCSYTPKRICHQVEESPKKVPRGGKKRSLIGLDAVKRKRRSALPPNYSDVELIALESNVIEKKEKREGRQSRRFGATKNKGKRRRVVVKRRRQKFRPAVSRKIVPTTHTPTKISKLSSREKFTEQTQSTFSGADVFLSRRTQSLTIEKDPKLTIAQPKQHFAFASPTSPTVSSNFFIPASLTDTATVDLAATAATQNVEKINSQNQEDSSISGTKATLKHQQGVLKLQQLQQQLLHIQRQQQHQQRLQHQKIVDLEQKLLRARQNKEDIDEGSAVPFPTPVPIQLTPSPILPSDNHRIDVEDDGSLKLSILIEESLKRTKPKSERKFNLPRHPSSKPKFASFPTRIPHTLDPIAETTPASLPSRTTSKFNRRPNNKKRLGTPTPRAKLEEKVKTTGGRSLKSSFGDSKKKDIQRSRNRGDSTLEGSKGKNCKELPKQNCQRLRVNPKPVWKNMTRKICRVPRTQADKKILEQLLERGDSVRSQRNAAQFHTVDGADHQFQSSNTRTSRARSQKSSKNNARQNSSPKTTLSRKNNRRGRQGRNRKNGGSNDPPNFSPFLNFPKFPRGLLERNS